MAKRYKRAWTKSAVAKGLSAADTAAGLVVMTTAYMPEVVPVQRSEVLDGPHYVHHCMPWLSEKAKGYLATAAAGVADEVYPDSLPIIVSDEPSTDDRVPVHAPAWAVKAGAHGWWHEGAKEAKV